jgi:hypothetical protein
VTTLRTVTVGLDAGSAQMPWSSRHPAALAPFVLLTGLVKHHHHARAICRALNLNLGHSLDANKELCRPFVWSTAWWSVFELGLRGWQTPSALWRTSTIAS